MISRRETSYFKSIQFNPGIEINQDQLIMFFGLTQDKQCSNIFKSSEDGPWNRRNIRLVFDIQEGKIKHFGSKHLELTDLQEKFSTISDELQPLKSQLEKFLSKLEDYIEEYKDTTTKEDKKYEDNRAIIKKEGLDFLRRGKPISLKIAGTEDFGPVFFVPEHGFVVKDIQKEGPITVGTTDIACCIAVFIHNPVTQKIGVAHLDDPTVEGYRKSLGSFFDQCGGTSESPNYVYIVGNELLKKGRIIPGIFPYGGHIHSQSLILSLYEFIEQRKDTHLEGTCFSLDSFSISGNIAVSVSFQECRFFSRVPYEEETSPLGVCVDFQELVDLNQLSLATPSQQDETSFKFNR